jgi:hypothetical protein
MLVMITAAAVVLVVLALLFVLITIAIRTEDKHATATTGPPPNSLARAARRIAGLHTLRVIPHGCPCQATTEPSRAHGERR